MAAELVQCGQQDPGAVSTGVGHQPQDSGAGAGHAIEGEQSFDRLASGAPYLSWRGAARRQAEVSRANPLGRRTERVGDIIGPGMGADIPGEGEEIAPMPARQEK